MDAVTNERICAGAGRTISTGGASDGLSLTLRFGGWYEERWSSDYRLRIVYHDCRCVTARFDGERWRCIDGDDELRRIFSQADEASLPQRLFQASAKALCAVNACAASGVSPLRVAEFLPCGVDDLTAAELLRLLMDEHGLALDASMQAVLCCCPDGFSVSDEELLALKALQGRTASVAKLLRDKLPQITTVWHDARLSEFRRPHGAVRCGEELELRFRVLSGQVDAASLFLYGDELHREYPMLREGNGFVCRLQASEQEAALWYRFRLQTADGERWLCPNESGYGSQLTRESNAGFRLTVFRRDFDTPAWFRKSVMYQVFPDRFAFSCDGTAERGLAYHRALDQTAELHQSLDETPRWQPRPFETDYIPDDFYGGTLRGIEQKLPYLKELGVKCLYLNPIVEARSNHRYDAADYLRVDPILGTNEDFEKLCRSAADFGIRIMLDGVFSHTGADSVYFNRYGHYPSPGACQSESSPYRAWYEFKCFPDEYRCWWGFQELPEVDELCESWQDFVVTGENSVVRQWLRRGAAGWRLDVADELPDEVLALIRRAAKAEKPDAPILGEVWEDAVVKESYGSRRRYALGGALDSVMNYPLRDAVLSFIHRRTNAPQLRDFLIVQQLNYPRPMYYSLMNLLGSHDVERLLSALSAPVSLRHLSRPEQLSYPFRDADRRAAPARERLCAALQFALPGVPSIYYGDEQGMDGPGDPFNRAPFREGDRALFDYYASLSARRNAHPCLQTGEAVFGSCHADVLTVLRYLDADRDVFGDPAARGAWLVVFNRSEEPRFFEADARKAGCGFIRGEIGPCRAEWLRLY